MEHFRPTEVFKIGDYSEESYFDILLKFPPTLAQRHLKYAESQHFTDEEIITYLHEVLQNRAESTTSSLISDEHIQNVIAGHEKELFSALETYVFNNPNNYLGTGMTAKVKLYEANFHNETVPMAIKYVVTPTEKTITAEREHNVIKEVDRMRMIEAAEIAFAQRSKYIRVPHPYLYHTTNSIQLYGMELIDGVTLEQACADGRLHQDMKDAIVSSPLALLDEKALDGYIERFFSTMHQYCLHGDIKPRNIMISRSGILYIIDFGQSVMIHNMPNGSEEQVDNLKNDEVSAVKIAVKTMLRKVHAS